MTILRYFLGSSFLFSALLGCSPVKPSIENQYQLDSYSQKQLTRKTAPYTLLVTTPEAVSGFQTNQMMYVTKKFELTNFAHSAWISPPADMLYPLMVQSLQHSGYFHAVASGVNSQLTDYRLDTQLIDLKQNFLKKPSFIDFSAKVVLSQVSHSEVIASRIIHIRIPCTSDAPYGGVIAANQAAEQFTANVTQFVFTTITQYQKKKSM